MRHAHIPGVKVKARFTLEKGRRYRHWMEITHSQRPKTGKTVCVIMQNPSYADASWADKSVQFMEKIVFERGLEAFGRARRLIVVNLYALVQTHDFQGRPEDIGASNNRAIRAAFWASEIVILGWGKSDCFQDRRQTVLEWLPGRPGQKLYQTRKHPSRGFYEGFIHPYERQKS